jgi:2-methylisocitrate lyase-like PEP mutase family enzyme
MASAEMLEHFRTLHHGDTPLLIPNPWDAGSARLLASVGFKALATTSSGFAATLGRLDGSVSRDEAIAHAAALVAAVDVPVSADLENGFGDDPAEVAETVRQAVGAGLAGCSIEDFTGDRDAPIYEFAHAVERVRAAAEAAHGSPGLLLTARAENHIKGRTDLSDTIARLQAFAEAGADVLYAPGLSDIGDITAVVRAVDRPVNVLARADAPTVAELGAAGVARISVGGAFAWAGYAGVVSAARELLDAGTYRFLEASAEGITAARRAFA